VKNEEGFLPLRTQKSFKVNARLKVALHRFANAHIFYGNSFIHGVNSINVGRVGLKEVFKEQINFMMSARQPSFDDPTARNYVERK